MLLPTRYLPLTRFFTSFFAKCILGAVSIYAAGAPPPQAAAPGRFTLYVIDTQKAVDDDPQVKALFAKELEAADRQAMPLNFYKAAYFSAKQKGNAAEAAKAETEYRKLVEDIQAAGKRNAEKYRELAQRVRKAETERATAKATEVGVALVLDLSPGTQYSTPYVVYVRQQYHLSEDLGVARGVKKMGTVSVATLLDRHPEMEKLNGPRAQVAQYATAIEGKMKEYLALSADTGSKNNGAEEKQKTLGSEIAAMRAKYDETKGELDEKTKAVTKAAFDAVKKAVAAFAEANDYDVVLDSSGQVGYGTPLVIFSDPQFDITRNIKL